MPRSAREMALVGVRCSRRSNDREGQALALRSRRSLRFIVGRGPVPRRASVCAGNGWLAFGFRVGRPIARDRPPRYDEKKRAVYRRARACPSPCLGLHGKRFVGVRFLRRSNDREGQALALRARERFSRHAPFGSRCSRTTVPGAPERSRGTGPRATVKKSVLLTVGRGPVPRRASVGRETALVGVRFSRRSCDREGQALALRARKGLSSACAVREQSLPNYSLLSLILLIVIIL